MERIKYRITIFYLSCKYYLQGDSWEFANEYAKAIVDGFKKIKGKI